MENFIFCAVLVILNHFIFLRFVFVTSLFILRVYNYTILFFFLF